MSASAVVITSIAAPNQVLRTYSSECLARGMAFLVMGDVASPRDFSLSGCDFWNIDRQEQSGLQLARSLPKRHYSRKNLGYLLAIRQGADVIIETDDDNHPTPAFWKERSRHQGGRRVDHQGWVNVYRYFSDDNIWPRGFPLQCLADGVPPYVSTGAETSDCPIQQGLADENPDVDAVYRLILPLPRSFGEGSPVILGSGSWCPFNSQNTTWFRDAFPLLYLPSHCSFRMTDIWRSFVAQRIAWASGWTVSFHPSTVRQERNEHDLLKDFADEIPGYLQNAQIQRILEDTDLHGGVGNLREDLLRCYRDLVQNGMIPSEELALVDAWCVDLSAT